MSVTVSFLLNVTIDGNSPWMATSGLIEAVDQGRLDKGLKATVLDVLLKRSDIWETWNPSSVEATAKNVFTYSMSPIALALAFHDTYERLAPDYGHKTKGDARSFDEESLDGKLMIAVCEEILNRFIEHEAKR